MNQRSVRHHHGKIAAGASDRLARASMSPAPRASHLPVKFHTELPDTGIPRASHHAECAVSKIPIRVHELGVIEDVEEFGSDFERHSLSDHRPLHQAEVGVVKSWTVEELAVRVAELPERAGSKCVRQEESVRAVGSRLSGILVNDVSDAVGHVSVPRSEEGIVSALADSNGQTARESSNACHVPALCQPLR